MTNYDLNEGVDFCECGEPKTVDVNYCDNCHEKLNNGWVFIGDVNPIEHGGIWIREEEGGNGEQFEFVKVQEWFDEHIAIAHGTLDITDDWIDREGVESYGDSSLAESPHNYVATVVDYYGIGEFDQSPNYLPVDDNTEELAKAYLKGQGIEF